MPALPFRRIPTAGLLVAALVALLFALPVALAAQTIVTVAPQQCVWHAGDDPAWSALNLDESGWEPYATSSAAAAEPRFWIRCRVNPDAFDSLKHPALEVRWLAAWEIFLDGASLGSNGNVESGEFGMNAIRILPVPESLVSRGPVLVALRVAQRYVSPGSAFNFASPEIRLGDELALGNDRAGYLLGTMPAQLSMDLPFVAIGLAGLFLLIFSLPEGSRPEAIVFGVSCIAAGLAFLNFLCAAMMLNVPAEFYFGLSAVASAASFLTQYLFPFAVARRKLPSIFWLPMSAWIVSAVWQIAEFFAPLSMALRMDQFHFSSLYPANYCAAALMVAAPLTAFWPWSQVPPRTRTIAWVATAFAVTQSLFFAIVFISIFAPTVFKNWMFPASSITQFAAIATIIALILRDQRQIALQRASLAGEMQAASEIQRMLAPASIESAAGLKIDVAFYPMREVGGDFYLCRVLSDGRQRVLLGDVSGKGAAAAMAATLLLGAAAARDADLPADLLQHLNRVLCENHIGGFATCLCADIAPPGAATIANAGHLPPYREGHEIELDSGLPLGISINTDYTETRLGLSPGDSLTFLSDGVVEARNAAGELFGFDRAAALSTDSAQNIAGAAQRFGQEDDITVLTLTLVPVEVAHV
jgi:serine phosphatase RsbU (regulator of sigma subunit)